MFFFFFIYLNSLFHSTPPNVLCSFFVPFFPCMSFHCFNPFLFHSSDPQVHSSSFTHFINISIPLVSSHSISATLPLSYLTFFTLFSLASFITYSHVPRPHLPSLFSVPHTNVPFLFFILLHLSLSVTRLLSLIFPSIPPLRQHTRKYQNRTSLINT